MLDDDYLKLRKRALIFLCALATLVAVSVSVHFLNGARYVYSTTNPNETTTKIVKYDNWRGKVYVTYIVQDEKVNSALRMIYDVKDYDVSDSNLDGD